MNPEIMYAPKMSHAIVPTLEVSPRLLNRKLNIIRHAVDIVEKQKGHATNKAVADYLGVSIEEYNNILQDANICRLFNSKKEVA